MAADETVLSLTDDQRRSVMKAPDEVSAMPQLRALGRGSKRIAAPEVELSDDRPDTSNSKFGFGGGFSALRLHAQVVECGTDIPLLKVVVWPRRRWTEADGASPGTPRKP
jgi:hypothetical protein